MKTLIAFTVAMALAASVFAMKIPTGDNVRVADIKQNGDAIVEVTLGGENTGITTPVGVVQAQAGSVVYFYDKGALKELTAAEQDVTTPIGTMKVKDGGKVTFYESGALATFSPADQTVDLPPLKGVRVLAKEGDMVFYESGKLKRVYFGENEPLQTPIGAIETSHYGESYIEYYESGSPSMLYLPDAANLTINGTEYGFISGWDSRHPYPIYLYDSGSSDRWLAKSFVTGRYKKNDTNVVSVAGVSKLGKLDVALNPLGKRRTDKVTFDMDGNILSCKLYKSPDFTVKVMGQKVYIKGGEYKQVYWDREGYKDERDTFCGISFYDDAATIKSCVLDELVMAEIDGIKLTIPAGHEVQLWENGNVKKCHSSNATKIKIGSKEVESVADTDYLFHKNGKLRAVQVKDVFVDTFYSDGAPKRLIRYKDVYDVNSDEGYVESFYSPKGHMIEILGYRDEWYVRHDATWSSFYLQPGDSGRNISMVFFDDDDNPSSYTMLKTDKDGNYILDDEGVPIEDPAKKKFRKSN